MSPPSGNLDPDTYGPTGRPVHLRALPLALVFVGGIVGTAARYGLSEAFPITEPAGPRLRFIANMLGAFVLGLLLEALVRAGDDTGRRRDARLLLGVGVCGAFTTYSTLALEISLFVRDHAAGMAALYAAVSVLAAPRRGLGRHRRRDRDDARAGRRMIVVLVLLAGAVGAVTRFVVDSEFKARFASTLPGRPPASTSRDRSSSASSPAWCFSGEPRRPGRPCWGRDSAAVTRLSAQRASKRSGSRRPGGTAPLSATCWGPSGRRSAPAHSDCSSRLRCERAVHSPAMTRGSCRWASVQSNT